MTSVAVMVCRHCSSRRVCRPRGLCWSCYYSPGVKDLFPMTGKFNTRGSGIGATGLPLPTPTREAPGTDAKLEVLRERARRGERLFHPDDATVED